MARGETVHILDIIFNIHALEALMRAIHNLAASSRFGCSSALVALASISVDWFTRLAQPSILCCGLQLRLGTHWLQ